MSHDWIDNLGRRSPRVLSPGAEELARGQRLQVFSISDFVVDEHLTARALPEAERWYGVVGVSYCVSSRSPQSSRLVARLLVHEPTTWWQRLRWNLLAWGDLVMMRRQLWTLKALAERSPRTTAARPSRPPTPSRPKPSVERHETALEDAGLAEPAGLGGGTGPTASAGGDR